MTVAKPFGVPDGVDHHRQRADTRPRRTITGRRAAVRRPWRRRPLLTGTRFAEAVMRIGATYIRCRRTPTTIGDIRAASGAGPTQGCEGDRLRCRESLRQTVEGPVPGDAARTGNGPPTRYWSIRRSTATRSCWGTPGRSSGSGDLRSPSAECREPRNCAVRHGLATGQSAEPPAQRGAQGFEPPRARRPSACAQRLPPPITRNGDARACGGGGSPCRRDRPVHRADVRYPRSDAPPQLHFIGPLSATGSQAPLPPWWDELDGTKPVVHVTQGTVANADYRQLIAPTLKALAGDDVLVVVSTGGRPVGTLPSLPPNARAAAFLPYDELLPRTAVYVTNGGYGGVQYALRHGVPIVATGGKEDKPEVGARVAWSGVGRRIRSEHPSPAALRTAIPRRIESPALPSGQSAHRRRSCCGAGLLRPGAVVDDLITAQAVGQ